MCLLTRPSGNNLVAVSARNVYLHGGTVREAFQPTLLERLFRSWPIAVIVDQNFSKLLSSVLPHKSEIQIANPIFWSICWARKWSAKRRHRHGQHQVVVSPLAGVEYRVLG